MYAKEGTANDANGREGGNRAGQKPIRLGDKSLAIESLKVCQADHCDGLREGFACHRDYSR